MADQSHRHQEAAARHERAALTHERAAAFWTERDDRARAELHRDAAAHERAGAALERRWADLTAADHTNAHGDDSPAGPTSIQDQLAEAHDELIGSEVQETQMSERLERADQRTRRRDAAARRDQAEIEREQDASRRSPSD